MLLYNCKQLTKCASEVEQIEAKVERLLLLRKEKEGEEEDSQHYLQLKLLLDFYYYILRGLNPSVIILFPLETKLSNSLAIAPKVSSCIIFERT